MNTFEWIYLDVVLAKHTGFPEFHTLKSKMKSAQIKRSESA